MSNMNEQLVNEQIKSQFVLLVMADGTSHGQIQTKEALFLAKKEGLDLVQVSSGEAGKFPVVKMIDINKFKYKQNKQAKHNAVHHNETKEIRFHLNIAPRDLEVKNKKVLELLHKKYKVKYVLALEGRQKSFIDNAVPYLTNLLEMFNEFATWTAPSVGEAKKEIRISSLLSPKGHH